MGWEGSSGRLSGIKRDLRGIVREVLLGPSDMDH